MHVTEGTWLYNASTGEVYVRLGEKAKGKVRIIARVEVGNETPEELEAADANGTLCAIAPELAEFVRDFAAQQTCAEKTDGCGDCFVCRAKDLIDQVPE